MGPRPDIQVESASGARLSTPSLGG